MDDNDITQLLDLTGRSYRPEISNGHAKVKTQAARHKRIRRTASISLALVVGMVSATIGLVLTVPGGNPANAVRYLQIPAAARIVDLTAPSNGLTDVYFADATHGIGMEQDCSLSPTADTTFSLVIARTSDSGGTWTPVGQALHVTYPDSRASKLFINFATHGKDGWIYGSKTFVTHNGGRSFEEDGRGDW